MSRSRSVRRLAAAGGSAALIVLATASAASAHVTVTPSTTDAGAYSVLTFAVPHGCDGSATTSVDIQIPDAFVTVTPSINPGWKVEKQMEKLAEPVDDGHGGQYTERVAQVVYTAKTPLPDGYRDSFELAVKLPDSAESELVFPAIQTCEKGETAWTQTVAQGQPEPEHPAPSITVTAAEGGDQHSGAAASPVAHQAAAVTGESGSSSTTVAWVGAILGALGLAAGGTALVRTRARS